MRAGIVLALAPLAAGCEIFIVGAAVTMATMYYHNGEGRKVYAFAYPRVAALAEEAAAQLALQKQEVSRGPAKTVIKGTNVDGESVRVEAIAVDHGRQTEVRVRVGMVGDYINTVLVFDYINEKLGLPLETSHPRPASPY